MNRKIVVFGTGLILILLLGGFLFYTRNSENETDETPTPVLAVEQTNQSTSSANPQAKPTDLTINSKKLAMNYFVYEKSEYEKAKAANRPILLFFYANWCLTCARQEPINVKTFNGLGQTNLIAFRVNYNDSDTSSDEDNLAKELGITYQHKFRLFDSSGKLISSFEGDTTESALKEKIAQVN